MTAKDILHDIATLAREKVGFQGELQPGMRLVEDLKLDSLHLLTLATEVEDHFQICLDEDDEATLETVGDLVGLVEKKLASSNTE